jgi:hypothetical protein
VLWIGGCFVNIRSFVAMLNARSTSIDGTSTVVVCDAGCLMHTVAGYTGKGKTIRSPYR